MSGSDRSVTVLVVDDEPGICRALRSYIEGEGHRAITAPNAEAALNAVQSTRPDLAFVDLRLPGMDGLELLERLREKHRGLEVILFTAYGGAETAMRAAQEGAYAYLQKPVDLDEIGRIVRRSVARPVVAVESADASRRVERTPVFCGDSSVVGRLRDRVADLSASNAPVLVVGEVGAGREAVGRELARRQGRAFRRLSCSILGTAALATSAREGQASAELVFLEALEDLLKGDRARVLAQIPRLATGALRHAASLTQPTNDKYGAEVRQVVADARERGWRLIEVAALRDRREDLPELVALFLARASDELGRTVRGVDAAALERLAAHDWPGNLRELENAIRVGVLSTREDVLTADVLALPEGPPGPRPEET